MSTCECVAPDLHSACQGIAQQLVQVLKQLYIVLASPEEVGQFCTGIQIFEKLVLSLLACGAQ